MQVRCPGASPVGAARLDGWRFIIMRGGYASVVPQRRSAVHGVLWRLIAARSCRAERLRDAAQRTLPPSRCLSGSLQQDSSRAWSISAAARQPAGRGRLSGRHRAAGGAELGTAARLYRRARALGARRAGSAAALRSRERCMSAVDGTRPVTSSSAAACKASASATGRSRKRSRTGSRASCATAAMALSKRCFPARRSRRGHAGRLPPRAARSERDCRRGGARPATTKPRSNWRASRCCRRFTVLPTRRDRTALRIPPQHRDRRPPW